MKRGSRKPGRKYEFCQPCLDARAAYGRARKAGSQTPEIKLCKPCIAMQHRVQMQTSGTRIRSYQREYRRTYRSIKENRDHENLLRRALSRRKKMVAA